MFNKTGLDTRFDQNINYNYIINQILAIPLDAHML